MTDWQQYVDRFIQFHERPILHGNGKVSHERMQQVAHQRYAEFDAKRRAADAKDADAADLIALKQAEHLLAKKKGE